MRWHEAISRIDRRVMYAFLTLCVIVPFFIPLRIPQNIMFQTKRLFDFVENIPSNEKAVMISFDYTPQTQPECHPMAIALLKQCFSRHIPVIGLSLDPQGPGLAVEAFATVVDEMNKDAQSHEDSIVYGEDYVYLGWKSGAVAVVIQMGESIKDVFPRDHFRNSVDSFPLMQRIRNYKNVAIVINLAAAAYPEDWVLYAQPRYGIKVGAGLTAVMAPEYYPFLQTDQFSGMISGMKGAAEYEKLIYDKGYAKGLGRAETAMDSQSMVHILMIVLIVLGNIGFFFSRKKK